MANPRRLGLSKKTSRFRIWVGRSLALALLAAAAACSDSAPNIDKLLAAANDAFKAGKYAQAESDYRQVLRLAQNPTAERQLAIIYSDQGQIQQAFPLLRRAAQRFPDDAEVQLRLAALLIASGQAAQAREALLKLLTQRPGDEHALLLLADSAIALKDEKEVEELIGELRQKDQDRAGYHIALGSLRAREQDFVRAESEFQTAIKHNPNSSYAYMMLGLLRWAQNDLPAAENAFKKAAELSPARSPGRFKYADFLTRTGSIAQARAFLEELHRSIPDAIPVRVALMKIACAEKRDANCQERVKEILAQDSTNLDATLENGVLSLASGDAPRAIKDLEYVSNILKGNAQVRYHLALAYVLSAKGRTEAETRKALEVAESYLGQAVELNPQFTEAVLLFAELKIRGGGAALAIEPLVRLIKEQPSIARAYQLLATAYLAQKGQDQALAVYKQMAERFPKDASPLFATGVIFLGQRKNAEARRALEAALELSPDFLPALEMVIDLEIFEKGYDRGIQRVQQRIEGDPKNAVLWSLMAKLNMAQGDLKNAEINLQKAIELNADLTAAYLMLTQVYLVSNRQKEAIEKLEPLAKNGDARALLLLASIHEQAKNFVAAQNYYERLLKVAPNSVAALNNLSMIYADRTGEIEKAHELAKRARELNATDPSVADTLGWILFKKGEYAQALPLLQEAAGRLSASPEVQFHLGLVHYFLGNEQLASVALQNAFDATTASPWKSEAAARLAMLRIKVDAADATARESVEMHLKQWGDDPIALGKLAAFQELEGSFERAISTYETILARYPMLAPAVRKLALLYSQRTTETGKAFEYATRARSLYPDDAEVAKILGVLNYRRDLFPRASELLGLAAKQRQDDAELYFFLGDSHRRLKHWAECSTALERAIALKLPPALEGNAKKGLEECSAAL